MAGRRTVAALAGAVLLAAGLAGIDASAGPAPAAARQAPSAAAPPAPAAPATTAATNAATPATAPIAPVPAGVPVRLGTRVFFELRAGEGGVPAAERAARAVQALRLALDDAACGPERLEIDDVAEHVEIRLCGRRVLAVHAEDATWEGSSIEATAARWAEALRAGFAEAKAERYGALLLRGAILGLLIPIAFLLVLLLVRAGSRRLQAALLRRVPEGGVRLGPVHVLATEGERRFLSGLVSLARVVVTLALAYALAIVLFRQLPWTRDLAAAMLRPFASMARSAGPELAALLPRLLALAVVVAVARLAARAVDRFVKQVRSGQVRLEPLVSPDNAFAAGLSAKIAILLAAVLAAALLLPGNAGRILMTLLALAGLALAIGARDVAANLLAGLVVLYGRPFRTGQQVRIGGHAGRVERKGLLHVRLRGRDGDLVIVPNAATLGRPVIVAGAPEALEGTVVLESRRGEEVAAGLLRHAAAEAGLPRAAGTVRLDAVRGGALVFRILWPLPSGADAGAVRDLYLRALLAHARGLEVGVLETRVGGGAGPA